MYILKKLRLGCGWITTEEDVDLATEAARTLPLKIFTAASEELTKNASLDIIALPDAWR